MADAIFENGVLTIHFSVDPEIAGWPPLTGRVRPATMAEARRYDGRVAALRKAANDIDPAKDPIGFEKAAESLTAYESEFFAAHIQSWSIGDAVTSESIGKLPLQYFAKLDGVCIGETGKPTVAETILKN